MTRRGAFAAALCLGLLVRLAALPLPGTEDVRTWKIWAFGASRHVTHVYGVGGTPPVRGVLTWQSLETTVDYPPAALYVLALVGLAYRQIDPAFADGPALDRGGQDSGPPVRHRPDAAAGVDGPADDRRRAGRPLGGARVLAQPRDA